MRLRRMRMGTAINLKLSSSFCHSNRRYFHFLTGRLASFAFLPVVFSIFLRVGWLLLLFCPQSFQISYGQFCFFCFFTRSFFHLPTGSLASFAFLPVVFSNFLRVGWLLLFFYPQSFQISYGQVGFFCFFTRSLFKFLTGSLASFVFLTVISRLSHECCFTKLISLRFAGQDYTQITDMANKSARQLLNLSNTTNSTNLKLLIQLFMFFLQSFSKAILRFQRDLAINFSKSTIFIVFLPGFHVFAYNQAINSVKTIVFIVSKPHPRSNMLPPVAFPSILEAFRLQTRHDLLRMQPARKQNGISSTNPDLQVQTSHQILILWTGRLHA